MDILSIVARVEFRMKHLIINFFWNDSWTHLASHKEYSNGYPDIIGASLDLVVLFVFALFFPFHSLLDSYKQSVTLPTSDWEGGRIFHLWSPVVVMRSAYEGHLSNTPVRGLLLLRTQGGDLSLFPFSNIAQNKSCEFALDLQQPPFPLHPIAPL